MVGSLTDNNISDNYDNRVRFHTVRTVLSGTLGHNRYYYFYAALIMLIKVMGLNRQTNQKRLNKPDARFYPFIPLPNVATTTTELVWSFGKRALRQFIHFARCFKRMLTALFGTN